MGSAVARFTSAPPSAENPQQAAPAGKAEQLPEVVVTQESQTQKKKKAPHKASAAKGPSAPAAPSAEAAAAAGSRRLRPPQPVLSLSIPKPSMTRARILLTQVGTNAYSMSQETLEALPQGPTLP